ncbi:MAG: tetratricopeptide repeat protein, partial [bacterium]
MNDWVKYRLGHSFPWPFLSMLVLAAILVLFDASVSPPAAVFQDTPSPAVLYKTAQQAVQKKDYSTAEKLFRQLVALDSRYQEPSGRSAWYGLGITLERQEKSMEAIQEMRRGLDSLKAQAKKDWYLNYDLARLYAEYASTGNEALITELVFDVFKNSL